jgi:D-serine deaminase-like pyridoxal phosphate-dependent protein
VACAGDARFNMEVASSLPAEVDTPCLIVDVDVLDRNYT